MPDDSIRTTAHVPDARIHDETASAAGGTRTAPPLEVSASDAPSIPGYDVLGEIARGGMGIVYAARDTVLGRDVAVKVLQSRFGVDSFSARRFFEEARITGRLEHPGIPPIHELGTLADGRPFLAMKLIRGETLAQRLASGERRLAIAEQTGRMMEQSADTGRSPLDHTPDLLPIFESICQAVGFAHANGVIHRDLKPSNVMVGAFGEVQVMDWGLAKQLRSAECGMRNDDPEATADESSVPHSDLTRAGSVLGTPAYMPPEQAVGAIDRVDCRSDVFGLGAILCALLTGKPPFVGADSESTRRLAACGNLDGAYARLAASGADPELVALCKRCLDPERDGRPANAIDVAAAVAALRAAAVERVRQAELDRARAEAEAREQRKRRMMQLALAGVAGLLLVAGGAFAWYAVWQDGERRAAERERAFEEQREADEKSRRDGLTATSVAELLTQCEAALRADDPERAGFALDAARQRSEVGGAEHHAERFARCRRDLDLLVEFDRLDNLTWTLADGTDQFAANVERPIVLRKFGIDPGATAPKELARRFADSVVRERLIAQLDAWHLQHRVPELLALLLALDPDPYRREVREAIAASRGDRVYMLFERPEALAQPPRFSVFLGGLIRITSPRKTQILLTAHFRFPSDFAVLMSLGHSLPEQNPQTAVERGRWFQAAIAVRPRSPAAWNGLGVALIELANLEAAERCFREAVRHDPQYVAARYNLGIARERQGDRLGSIAEYREAIRIHPKYSFAHYNLGRMLFETNDMAGAEAELREAIACDPRYAPAHYVLAVILMRKGEYSEAEAMAQKSTELDKANGRSWFILGSVRQKRGDPTGAEAAYRESVRLAPNSPEAHHELGGVLLYQKRPNEAIVEYEIAAKLKPAYPGVWLDMGLAHSAAGNTAKAAACYREAIRLDPQYAQAHTNLSAMLIDLGELEAGLFHAEEALRLNPNSVAARKNRELALRRIAARDKNRTPAPPPREVKRP